jgi:hypothetical protein
MAKTVNIRRFISIHAVFQGSSSSALEELHRQNTGQNQ